MSIEQEQIALSDATTALAAMQQRHCEMAEHLRKTADAALQVNIAICEVFEALGKLSNARRKTMEEMN